MVPPPPDHLNIPPEILITIDILPTTTKTMSTSSTPSTPSSSPTSTSSQPSISTLPTELWYLIIHNLDLPSLEKAICAFYSLRTQCIPTIEPTLLPNLLRWLDTASGTEELVMKYPFEVLDSIFQLLEPQQKVNVAVGLWRQTADGRNSMGTGGGAGALH